MRAASSRPRGGGARAMARMAMAVIHTWSLLAAKRDWIWISNDGNFWHACIRRSCSHKVQIDFLETVRPAPSGDPFPRGTEGDGLGGSPAHHTRARYSQQGTLLEKQTKPHKKTLLIYSV